MCSSLADLLIREPNVSLVLEKLAELPIEAIQSTATPSGGTLLFESVQRPNDSEALRVTRYLVETARLEKTNVKDVNGQTCLFFAARDGNVECAKYLVEKGCDPNAVDSAGQTCLFYAARDGRLSMVEYLVSVGMDLNYQDKMGQSALFYAARDGRTDVVMWMIDNNANASIRDKSKKCPHHYAAKRNRTELAAILRVAAEQQETPGFSGAGGSGGGSSRIKHNRSRQSSATNGLRASILERQRELCELQFSVELENGRVVWLNATPQMVEQFSSSYPRIGIWKDPSNTNGKTADPLRPFLTEWSKIALQVVNTASSFDGAWIFNKPVDVKAWNCLDYYIVIKEPRDFGTIKQKLKSLQYRSIQTFIHDMELVLSNCFQYNPPESRVYLTGKKIEEFCRKLFVRYEIAKWVEDENLLIQWIQRHGRAEFGVSLTDDLQIITPDGTPVNTIDEEDELDVIVDSQQPPEDQDVGCHTTTDVDEVDMS